MNWFEPSFNQQQPPMRPYSNKRYQQSNQRPPSRPYTNNTFQPRSERPTRYSQQPGMNAPPKSKVTFNQINNGVQKLQMGLQLVSTFLPKR